MRELKLPTVMTIAAALAAGALLYVGGRSADLRFFAWGEAVGLGSVLAAVADAVGPVVKALPSFAVYSLPFGLWVLAFALLLRRSRWALVPVLLAGGAELGQLTAIVPGTFDPVDLITVVVCGVLPVLGQARIPSSGGHLAPAAATLVFVVLAAGTTETEEEKAVRKEKEAEKLTELDAYEKTLASVHQKISGLDLKALAKKPCKGVKVELPKDTHGLRTVHLDFLKRFGADAKEWTKNDGGWAFVTDSTFGGHFAEHRDNRTSHAVQDTVKRVQETFLPERYLVVVAPITPEMAVLPVMKDKHFEGGSFLGWIFLADQASGELACQMPIGVTSSEEIDFGGMFDGDDPEKEMLEDFEDNFEGAIEGSLPPGIDLSTGYGSILR